MTGLRALTAPSLDDIEALARDAFARMPVQFRDLCGDIVFRVEDFADPEVLNDLEIESEYDLTGLFYGHDIASREAQALPREPSMIFLYRIPIIAEWAETGVELGALVSHVIVHEIGHHFGLSDDDIDRIERAAD